MKLISIIPFILAISAPTSSAAESYLAIPITSFEAKYPINYETQKIFGSERFTVVAEKPDAYLIIYEFDDSPHIVSLPKRNENDRAISFRDGNVAGANGTLFIDFDTGFIAIEKAKSYKLSNHENGKVEIIYPLGEAMRRISLPEKAFKVISEKKYQELIQQQKTAKKTLISSNKTAKKDKLSAEQLKKLATNESLRAERVHTTKVKNTFESLTVAEDAIGLVTNEEGSGTGFLCEMDGVVFFFTNNRIIGSGKHLKIHTKDGTSLQPQLIEFAKDRDLVRISIVEQPRALEYTDEIRINEPVVVYSMSDDDSVTSKPGGRVKGVTHERIEMNAGFLTNDDGSPLINRHGKVIGMATHNIYSPSREPDWLDKLTDFDKTRGFAIKLSSDIEWVPFHPEAITAINGQITSEESTMLQSIELLSLYSNKPQILIISPDIEDLGLKDWILAHNAISKGFTELENKNYTPQQKKKAIEVLRNRNIAKGRSLSKFFKRKADDLSLLHLVPETEFHRQKVEQLKSDYYELSETNDSLNARL